MYQAAAGGTTGFARSLPTLRRDFARGPEDIAAALAAEQTGNADA